MNIKKVSYLWLIFLVLIFPVIQCLTYLIRFGSITKEIIVNSLYFAPMGLVTGIILIYLLRKEDEVTTKNRMVYGYAIGGLVAMPLAIASGLIVMPIVATTLVGSLPILIGIYIGYKV